MTLKCAQLTVALTLLTAAPRLKAVGSINDFLMTSTSDKAVNYENINI
jgi:hypothetical protein